jgi:hypothetical protein
MPQNKTLCFAHQSVQMASYHAFKFSYMSSWLPCKWGIEILCRIQVDLTSECSWVQTTTLHASLIAGPKEERNARAIIQ